MLRHGDAWVNGPSFREIRIALACCVQENSHSRRVVRCLSCEHGVCTAHSIQDICPHHQEGPVLGSDASREEGS